MAYDKYWLRRVPALWHQLLCFMMAGVSFVPTNVLKGDPLTEAFARIGSK